MRSKILDPLRVLDAGKLHQDPCPCPSLALNHRLRHAELVDAVANRLQRLADRVVAHIAAWSASARLKLESDGGVDGDLEAP